MLSCKFGSHDAVSEANKPHVLFSRFDFSHNGMIDAQKLYVLFCRFDFSHNGVIDAQKLGDVEGMCRQAGQQEQQIYSKEVSLEEAQKINGMPVLTPGHSNDQHHMLVPLLSTNFLLSLCQKFHCKKDRCQKVHCHCHDHHYYHRCLFLCMYLRKKMCADALSVY